MIYDLHPKYNPFDKELLVYTSEYPFSSLLGLYEVRYINNLSTPIEITKAIEATNPSVLAIYPSILRSVLEYNNYKLPSNNIKLVLLNSEQSTQLERDEYEKLCNCSVMDEFSSEELLSIACQCACKKYHLVQDCSYIELLRPNTNEPVLCGEEGEIVGTNLINFSMPIIRYRQEDFATFAVEQYCSCGKTTPIIECFSGRINSSFKKMNGELIASGKILDWTYSLVLTMNLGIKEFEIIQHTFTNITANLVVDDRFVANQDEILFKRNFNQVFGDEFIININIVTHITKTKSGKHIPIRSLV